MKLKVLAERPLARDGERQQKVSGLQATGSERSSLSERKR
ncbi:hypothetical protein A2U01_0052973, partial [Trifolium medium]|nr:hypothetical protein [Trifolium medium]